MFDKKGQENYRKAVKKAKELKMEIKNPSIDHAGILMDELLQYAIDEKLPIKLVSGCLKKDFYANLSDKFREALDAKCKIEVLVECDKDDKIENKELYKILNNSENASIHTIKEDNSVIHFMLIGDSAYRVETSKEYKTAIGHFDNCSIGELLLNRFNKYKQ
jgi:hypothetical protein